MRHTFSIWVFTLAAAMAFNGMLLGQGQVTLDPGADFVSRYVWRGTDFGNSPSVQPSLEVGYGGFALGAWGSYTTNNANFQEVDLYASYTIRELFTLMVTDYFFPDATVANNRYFNYEKDKTGHVFEGSLSFNGTETLPLSVLLAMNFAGADARTVDNNLQYSTYIEFGYSTSVGETDLDFFLGGTPTKPDSEKGETGFYGAYEGVVNVGVKAGKTIQVTDKYALPVNVSLITNPQRENIFLVFGISF